jgi:hypothetical protein
MKKTALAIPLTCFVLLCLPKLNGDMTVSAQTLPKYLTKGAQVTISASLGEPVLRLWGYGPANSTIELSGDRVSDFTYSTGSGYFEFKKTFLPTDTGLYYPELCLTAIDQIGRATPPTCIPALPTNEYSYDIGPVILPPTISLSAGVVAASTQTEASGTTIPNSDVNIILAEGDTSNIAKLSIVRTAYAFFVPNLTVKSDSHGNFSFNMPGTFPDNWRVFAITDYSQGATSPKSNTLKFEVVSVVTIALKNIWKWILSLLTLPVFIIFEILVILLIITATFLHKKGKRKVYLNVPNPVREYQDYLNQRK